MNKNLSVTKTIELNSTPEKVWNVLTNPKKIKIYLFGAETISNWEKGSPIIFQGEFQGKKYKDKGIIKEIIPEQLFQYEYWSIFSGLEDTPNNYSLVTYKLHQNNSVTTLTITQKGFANEQAQQHTENGWAQALSLIKEIVENE